MFRAALWPQLTARLQGRVIDDDRANVGLPERAGSAALELSQLIYAEPTWANLRIQQSLQVSREAEKTITLLDVVLETTTRYLQVLSAKIVERIQRDNLNLTRTNLELARVRRSIGVARPNEVLRWESQMANNRRQVINAFSQRERAQIALNRVLHRPLEERFATTEPELDDSSLMTSFARILPYINNPRYFEILRDFMVQQGLEAAPELQQSAQQRLRPILLTTCTTIGGLIPLWLGGGPMWEPMAVAIIFGLLFATELTLGVVSTLYAIFFRVSFRGFRY